MVTNSFNPTRDEREVVPSVLMAAVNSELHYEIIETRARPARVALLTDCSDADWHHTMLRIIEFLSSIWGGKHSVIIPTNGTTIAPILWTILEKFSPDYVFFYRKTGRDVQISRPGEYTAYFESIIEQLSKDSTVSDAEKERIHKELGGSWADEFDLGLAVRGNSEVAAPKHVTLEMF
jgi:hypothetical protein